MIINSTGDEQLVLRCLLVVEMQDGTQYTKTDGGVLPTAHNQAFICKVHQIARSYSIYMSDRNSIFPKN